ncbi:MAG TPA: hypothetical protein PKK06_07715 [Phycisphaerae bacterium]|nr:hypothetical protein [Phycisphaerae bacterium]HNU46077.1 hypothetical protein [Phycisphaerae bacterium]
MRQREGLITSTQRRNRATELGGMAKRSAAMPSPGRGTDSRRSLPVPSAWACHPAPYIARAMLLGLVLAVTGCPPRAVPPLDPLPLQDAARIVNDNLAAVGGTLRATGSVDGYTMDARGRRVHYTLDGFLLFLPPRHLRFDLKSIAGTELLFGSNQTYYWYFSRPDDESYYCRRHKPGETLADVGIPINPAQLVDALGLTPIPVSPMPPAETTPVQRVEEEYQQLLFIATDDTGRSFLEREYWLDRRAPRLPRRVQFRDLEGVLIMESRLGDYARLSPNGPWLPRTIDAYWPTSDTHLRFHISRWQVVPDIGPTDPPFTPPHQLGLHYRQEYIEE